MFLCFWNGSSCLDFVLATDFECKIIDELRIDQSLSKWIVLSHFNSGLHVLNDQVSCAEVDEATSVISVTEEMLKGQNHLVFAII